MPNLTLTPRCDLCGGLAEDGWEIRYYGRRDPVTGYQDESIVCSYCIEADDDGRYEAADSAYDLSD